MKKYLITISYYEDDITGIGIGNNKKEAIYNFIKHAIEIDKQNNNFLGSEIPAFYYDEELTLEEAIAAVAAHLGEVDEEKIDNMSYVWFNNVLKALGKRIAFESISNLYGNSFAKDANKYIQEANPLNGKNGKHAGNGGVDALTGKISVVKLDKSKDSGTSLKEISKMLGGDISWIGDFREGENKNEK